ncbi:MAG: TrkA C-terminal domain-containing protein, partial [Chthoniobacterales bacterium]
MESAGQSILVLSLIVALGLFLGRARILGVSVGVIGVLTVGLIFGHLGVPFNHEVMDFARETGLILFVYTVGLQLGPSFLSSLRRQGLPLNLLAAFVVLAGVGVIVALHYGAGLPMSTGIGIYTGGVTNTPALGAAQEALRSFSNVSSEALARPGLAYAMTYPFGVLGIIISLLVLRSTFQIEISREEEALAARELENQQPLKTLNLTVKNTNLEGRRLNEIPGRNRVTISRILHEAQPFHPTPTTTLHVGDTLLAVGVAEDLEAFRIVVGENSNEDLRKVSGPVSSRRMLVTRNAV